MTQYLICHTNGFMNVWKSIDQEIPIQGDQFCTAGKAYVVIEKYEDYNGSTYIVIDDNEHEHEFNAPTLHQWFELKEWNEEGDTFEFGGGI